MRETAFKYKEQLLVRWINNFGQLRKGGSSVWGLATGITRSHYRRQFGMKYYIRPWTWKDYLEWEWIHLVQNRDIINKSLCSIRGEKLLDYLNNSRRNLLHGVRYRNQLNKPQIKPQKQQSLKCGHSVLICSIVTYTPVDRQWQLSKEQTMVVTRQQVMFTTT
jgi:hypothetical protein